MSENDKKQLDPFLSALIDALLSYYSPADTAADATDSKSTQEIIEEMDQIEDVLPADVNNLMVQHGFKLNYTGSGYVWMLKTRN